MPDCMAERTINCADCGQETVARRSNAKYCDVCRLVRFRLWIKKQTYTCDRCDEKFLPLRRDDIVCGGCSMPTTTDVEGKCGVCGNESSKLVSLDARICRDCGTNPELRAKINGALFKKQDKLKEANG